MDNLGHVAAHPLYLTARCGVRGDLSLSDTKIIPAALRPVSLGGVDTGISLAIPDSAVTVYVTSKSQGLSGAVFMQYAARTNKSVGFLVFSLERVCRLLVLFRRRLQKSKRIIVLIIRLLRIIVLIIGCYVLSY